MRLNISEILEATKGRLISGSKNETISGVSTDTRTIKPGDLFIALEGKNFDGHDFIGEAVKKGTAGIIVGAGLVPALSFRAPTRGAPTNIIQVKDTLKALGDIAYYYRMKFSIPFIGITGSNGKTTAKEMIYKVLSRKFHVLRSEGTENNLIGLPAALLRLEPRHDIAVLELGTNHFGEIKRLSKILSPDVGIITNIGPSHIEFLRSEEGVLREKAALVKILDKEATAVLNADDESLSRIKRLKCRVVRFGMERGCDFKATRRYCKNAVAEFIVNDKYEFKIKLLGRHNIYNALVAIAVGFLYKVEYEDIYKALLEFQPLKGRVCLRRIGDVDIMDDAYNSNPGSLRAAIEVLTSYETFGRKMLVFADMLELGGQADRFHNQAGRLAAEGGIDYLITVGSFREVVNEAAFLGGMPKDAIFSCRDNRAVLATLKKILKPGDAVLLKGSRLRRLNEVVDALPSFISTKRNLVRV